MLRRRKCISWQQPTYISISICWTKLCIKILFDKSWKEISYWNDPRSIWWGKKRLILLLRCNIYFDSIVKRKCNFIECILIGKRFFIRWYRTIQIDTKCNGWCRPLYANSLGRHIQSWLWIYHVQNRYLV